MARITWKTLTDKARTVGLYLKVVDTHTLDITRYSPGDWTGYKLVLTEKKTGGIDREFPRRYLTSKEMDAYLDGMIDTLSVLTYHKEEIDLLN